MLIYRVVCRYSSTYIGRTCQHLEVRIRQQIPKVILSKSRQTSGHSLAMDLAIGEHLFTINSCKTSYEDDCFSVLHRARDKIHLKILESIYIAINRPNLCRQLSCHILNIFWELLETGVTWIFFHLVSIILLINSNAVFKHFPVTKLDKCRTKGPSLFYRFRIVSPLFTNDFINIYIYIYI